MGLPMAGHLARAGLLTGVWNRSRAKAEVLAAETGCTLFKDPAELAKSVDLVILCVSADQDVLDIVKAMGAALRPGSIVVDCSTVSAVTAREAAGLCQAAGAQFLDCPVSGGVEGARNATLAMMCGGDEAAFKQARPALEKLAKSLVLLGPCGAGQATKATNQIMCAGIIQVVAEAMAFARAEGLPLDKVIDVLGKGAGSSWYFVHRAPFMARGEYPAGFRVRLHQKDLGICRDMAAAHGAALPSVDSTLASYRELIEQGFGDEDISSIFRLKARLYPDKDDG